MYEKIYLHDPPRCNWKFCLWVRKYKKVWDFPTMLSKKILNFLIASWNLHASGLWNSYCTSVDGINSWRPHWVMFGNSRKRNESLNGKIPWLACCMGGGGGLEVVWKMWKWGDVKDVIVSTKVFPFNWQLRCCLKVSGKGKPKKDVEVGQVFLKKAKSGKGKSRKPRMKFPFYRKFSWRRRKAEKESHESREWNILLIYI